MKLVIIPVWLRKALDNAKMDYTSVTSANDLVSILSLDDVAFYFYINNNLTQFIKDIDVEQISVDSYCKPLTTEVKDRIDDLMNFRNARPNVDLYQALIGGLDFSEDHKEGISFKVKLIDDQTIGVFPYLLDEGACPIRASINFLDDLIKTHLITTPFEVVAKKQHFKKYIARLSNI